MRVLGFRWPWGGSQWESAWVPHMHSRSDTKICAPEAPNSAADLPKGTGLGFVVYNLSVLRGGGGGLFTGVLLCLGEGGQSWSATLNEVKDFRYCEDFRGGRVI